MSRWKSISAMNRPHLVVNLGELMENSKVTAAASATAKNAPLTVDEAMELYEEACRKNARRGQSEMHARMQARTWTLLRLAARLSSEEERTELRIRLDGSNPIPSLSEIQKLLLIERSPKDQRRVVEEMLTVVRSDRRIDALMRPTLIEVATAHFPPREEAQFEMARHRDELPRGRDWAAFVRQDLARTARPPEQKARLLTWLEAQVARLMGDAERAKAWMAEQAQTYGETVVAEPSMSPQPVLVPGAQILKAIGGDPSEAYLYAQEVDAAESASHERQARHRGPRRMGRNARLSQSDDGEDAEVSELPHRTRERRSHHAPATA
jgi:hypothetical protein